MVNIPLSKDWVLQSDSHQYILVQNNRNFSFHSTIESAILSYFELQIRNSDAISLQMLMDCHKSSLDALQQALLPLKIKIVGCEK